MKIERAPAIISEYISYETELYQIPWDVIEEYAEHPLLEDLFLIRAGYKIKAPDEVNVRTSFPYFQLILVTEGSGWYRYCDREILLEPGHVLITPPHIDYTYGNIDHNPWSYQWVIFSGWKGNALLNLANLTASKPVVAVAEHFSVLHSLNEILETLRGGYSMHHLMKTAGYLRQVLTSIAFINQYEPSPYDKKGLDVERVINYMLDHLDGQCTLEEFAREVHLSRSYFAQQFNAKTGYSPIDYYIRLKIQKACKLLATSDLSIKEIAQCLGYDDPYYFSRSFRKIMDCSPREYRNCKVG